MVTPQPHTGIRSRKFLHQPGYCMDGDASTSSDWIVQKGLEIHGRLHVEATAWTLERPRRPIRTERRRRSLRHVGIGWPTERSDTCHLRTQAVRRTMAIEA